MNRFKSKEIFFLLSLSAGILLYTILIFIINLTRFHYQLNADIASDVILGELIWNTRQLIPDTWYMSTEARIIANSNISALFFGITKNMTLAMGLACCLMTLLIVGSILYFCKTADFPKSHTALMIFLCLAIPSTLNILELLYLFAGYYAEHIIILFITLAVYVRIMRIENIIWPPLLVTSLLAFVLGLQGLRGILVIYGPLLGIEIIRNIYLSFCHQKRQRHDIALTLWTVLELTASFIGTCFPFSVGQNLSRNIRKGAYKLVTIVLPDMRNAAGFTGSGLAGRICLLALSLTALYLVLNILHRMWNRENIKPIEWAWLTVCASPFITALAVAFTTVESTPRYYFVLPFLMALSVPLLWQNCSIKWKSVTLSAIVILSILNITRIYFPIICSDYPPKLAGEYQVVEFLKENNYLTAYATFENANTMTVLSNGDVRVYSVATIEKMDICKWLTSTDWYFPNVPYEHKTAYIVTETEMTAINEFFKGKENLVHEAATIGKYHIFFSDYNFSNLD